MSSKVIKKMDKSSKIREKRLILANQVKVSQKHTMFSRKTYGEFV